MSINIVELEKIKRLSLWAKGKNQYPVIAEITCTQKCNQKCKYCIDGSNGEGIKRELKTKEWKIIIKELRKIKIKRIILAGRESLCRPDINIIFKAIKKAGVEGYLLTNGTLFNEKLIKLLIDLKWDLIVFSLDSANPKINDSLRGEGSFEKVIEAIKMFNKLKEDKFSKPRLMLHTVLTNKNYKQLPSLIKLANDLKIVNVTVSPVIACNKEGEKLIIKEGHKKSLQEYLKKTDELAKKHRISVSIGSLIEKKRTFKYSNTKQFSDRDIMFNPKCFFPFFSLTIREDGTIIPCAFNTDVKERFKKNKSFDLLWFGEKFTKFRKAILNHEIPKCCLDCHITRRWANEFLKQQVREFLTQPHRKIRKEGKIPKTNIQKKYSL